MEEKDIKYKQINIPSMMIFVLAIALYIMGAILSIFWIIDCFSLYTQTNTNTSLIQGILFCVLEAYFLYDIIVSLVIFSLSMKLKLEKHPKLYPFLVFTTLNIPCGFLLIKSIRNNLEVED